MVDWDQCVEVGVYVFQFGVECGFVGFDGVDCEGDVFVVGQFDVGVDVYFDVDEQVVGEVFFVWLLCDVG